MGLYDQKPCPCGSGEIRMPLFDAQGVFKSFVCHQCEEEVKSRYQPWVFSGYDQKFLDEYSGERIEDDY